MIRLTTHLVTKSGLRVPLHATTHLLVDRARQDSHQYENLSCRAIKDAYADTDVCMCMNAYASAV